MSKNIPASKNTTALLLMGLFATFMGLFIILVSVDILHTDPESIHAPRWVLTLAGVMFTFVGLYVLSTGIFSTREQSAPIIRWTQYFLILGMLSAFAAVFLWVGFGSGEREFSSSGSIGIVTVSRKGNDIMGRIMFGGGGIFSAILAGYFSFTEARKIINDSHKHDADDE